MTNPRAGWSYGYRDFPPCACSLPHCDGRPEAGLKISPGHTEAPTTNSTPLPDPYRPTLGSVVLDTLNNRLGILMEHSPDSPAVHLRPVRGGCEWETDARWLERPPAAHTTPATL